MKKPKIFIVLGLFALTSVVFANEAIVILPNTKQISKNEFLKTVLHDLKLSRSDLSFVFTESEQRYLSQAGYPELALTVKTNKVESNKIGVSLKLLIQRNAVVQTQEDSLKGYQWGLENTGKSQPVAIGDFNTKLIQGIAREDIRKPKRPANDLKKIIVAVLDTGVDITHPDLKNKIYVNQKECDSKKLYQTCLKDKQRDKASCDKEFLNKDSDGNGYPLDCNGWNITANQETGSEWLGNSDIVDEVGHGTHVSGIIAAETNGIGIEGAAENVIILPVKVIQKAPNAPVRPQSLQSDDEELPSSKEKEIRAGLGFVDRVARGMLYAIRTGAKVINLSLAWPSWADTDLMRKMVEIAQKRGIVIVAASGNDANAETRVMPCHYSGVICVAAHGPDGKISHFSNYGSGVDVAAPGLRILSTFPLDKRSQLFTEVLGYEYKNGTSMASPFVAGAVAYLMGQGMSADEARARILLGARPQSSEDIKTIRYGNLDLERSQDAVLLPLVEPETKEPVRTIFNSESSKVEISIPMINRSIDIEDAQVAFKILNSTNNEILKAGNISLGNLGYLERSNINLFLDSKNILDLPGRVNVELQVTSGVLLPRKYLLTVAIVNTAGSASETSRYRSFPIRGGVVTAASGLRTIKTQMSESSKLEYLGIQKTTEGNNFQLVSESGDSFLIKSQREKFEISGTILEVHRLNVDLVGGDEYVLIERVDPKDKGSMPLIKIRYLTENLQDHPSLKELIYDNDSVVMPQAFEWIQMRLKNSTKQWVPAWVSGGKTPALEKTPFDPWEPDAGEEYQSRFYYLSPEGLHSLTSEEATVFVKILPRTASQLKTGEVDVLSATGEDYQQEYKIKKIRDLEVIDDRVFELSKYRMLLGANTLNVNTFDVPGQWMSFSSASVELSHRVTFIDFVTGKMLDQILKPSLPIDTVVQVAAAYLAPKTAGVFALTQYQVEYYDLEQKKQDAVTRARYSFLPSFISNKAFFPVMVRDLESDRIVPGLYIPEDFSGLGTMEVVVPKYNASGEFMKLLRPASMHLIPTAGCTQVGNPLNFENSRETEIIYICKDKIIRYPLQF